MPQAGEEPTMAEVKRAAPRPLSPHLQIYRWHIPMLTSILTRISGNGIIVGAILFILWLGAAAAGPAAFAAVDGWLRSWLGLLVLTGVLWAVWYHYLAGLRHLYHDAGKGLDIPTAERLGIACLAGSVVLTVLTLLII
jgi:succinate dehydrogenase / fumarate reductase cytochrome b subunit